MEVMNSSIISGSWAMGVVWAMCVRNVGVSLSLWTPSLANVLAILLPVIHVCDLTLCMDILCGI